jgi:hypothetical protein
VQQVTGSEQSRVLRPKVWTSTDGGETWRRARVRGAGHGSYRVGLPDVEAGTSVSLRVEAHDVAGSGIEQILYDAYTG